MAPDGSLLISIGGRKTRGSVYRVTYEGPKEPQDVRPTDELTTVLRAPQPLDAWSRARWEPVADKLGKKAFLEAINVETQPSAERVRAIEIVTERFGGLPNREGRLAAVSTDLAVRARVAWSYGRATDGLGGNMIGLLLDQPPVRRAAFEALQGRSRRVTANALNLPSEQELPQVDRRLRLAVAQAAAGMDGDKWAALLRDGGDLTSQGRLTALYVQMLREADRPVHAEVASSLVTILERTADPKPRFQIVRLLMRALGDYHLHNPLVEVEAGYSLQPDLSAHNPLLDSVLREVRPLLPSKDDRLDEESARLLGMLEDDDPATLDKVAAFLTELSPPTRDLHFLIVLSRLNGRRDQEMTARVARAVVSLDWKLKGQEQRIKQSWNARVTELVALLQKKDPAFSSALRKEPRFVTPNHVSIALELPPADRKMGARRYLDAAKADPEFVWAGPLIELLGTLPTAESRPLFRSKWNNLALRDSLLPHLVEPADVADREPYLDSLDSPQADVVRAALGALERLGADANPEHLVPLIRLVRRTAREPKEAETTRRVIALIERAAGGRLDLKGRRADDAAVSWFEKAHPALSKKLTAGGDDLAAWTKRIKTLDWSRGDVARGSKVFQERGCQTCHDGPRALGPDLSGVTDRFARADLFAAIVAPNLDVSPLYKTTLVETRQGLVHSGTIAFESVDGLMIQTGATTTVRVASDDVATREPGTKSLMPEQLLAGLSDPEIADLDAYLRSLSNREK